MTTTLDHGNFDELTKSRSRTVPQEQPWNNHTPVPDRGYITPATPGYFAATFSTPAKNMLTEQ